MAYAEKVRTSMLFHGMTDEEIEEALSALHAHEKSYRKGSPILYAGDTTKELGIVLSGSVTVENTDLWGNRSILTIAEEGDFFAETYAILESESLLVDVAANEDCRVLFLAPGRLLGAPAGPVRGQIREARTAEAPAPDMSPASLLARTPLWQIKFTRNLLRICARKNLTLSGRAFHTSPKTIRGRIMAYLDTIALRKHSHDFDIPFDRQQMADYLNVDRSALSKELGKMKKDGLIDYRHSHFTIL